jgi:hypothetical protein
VRLAAAALLIATVPIGLQVGVVAQLTSMVALLVGMLGVEGLQPVPARAAA